MKCVKPYRVASVNYKMIIYEKTWLYLSAQSTVYEHGTLRAVEACTLAILKDWIYMLTIFEWCLWADIYII